MATSVAERPARQITPVVDNSMFRDLLDTARFEHLWRLSTAFAKSELVPQSFQNKPENCFVALQMAIRLQVDPFMFLQSCYVVHGRPGIEAKLAIALANRSGVFGTGIAYRLQGDGMNRSCTASAVRADSGEVVEETVTMAMAKAEGWIDKQGSKWKTIPDLMLKYRAAMFLIRLNCPEVIMGMQSREELEDIESRTIDVSRKGVVAISRPDTLDALTAQIESASQTADESAGVEEQAADQVGAPLDMESVKAAFADCTELKQVTALEDQLSAQADDADSRGAIADLADRQREFIRSTRGSRSNGK